MKPGGSLLMQFPAVVVWVTHVRIYLAQWSFGLRMIMLVHFGARCKATLSPFFHRSGQAVS